MPVTGTNPNGNFQGCKIENGTILKLRGLKVLEDEHGIDLLKLLRKGATGGSSELEAIVTNLLSRISVVETYLQNMPPPAAAVSGSGKAGPKGDQGDQGEQGEQGERGLQGPKGKDGAKKLADLTDVDLDGLEDGATLIWSAKDKKFVVGLTEE